MKEEEQNCKSMADLFSKLPSDIIIDILTRLPLKTISKCRWVSKSWYNFILDSSFADLHFSKHKHDSLCAIFPTRFGQSYLIDPECLSKHETSVLAFDLNLKKFRENFSISDGYCARFEVIGTVNGLVGFAPERHDYESAPYYIVNPITGDYLLVPKSPKNDIEPVVSGFGFDPIKSEYKVVRILPNPLSRGKYGSKKESNDRKFGHTVEIYTLGSGTWREIQLHNLTIVSMRQFNVLLHGCLHGISIIDTELRQFRTIISFDMTREEFSLLEMPPRNQGGIFNIYDLVVLNECLCVLDGVLIGDTGKNLWVMKIHGVHSSWVKEYYFKPKVYRCSWHGYHEVMGLKTNNLLLVDSKGNLIYYDYKDGISKSIMLHDLKGNLLHVTPDFPVYVKGSLFSPKAIDCRQSG